MRRSRSRTLLCVCTRLCCAWVIPVATSPRSWAQSSRAAVPFGPGAGGREGSSVSPSTSFFCASAAATCPSRRPRSSCSRSISSSRRRRSLAAVSGSRRGTLRRRLSTEPISRRPVALPSIRIEFWTAPAGRSGKTTACSPGSRRTLARRVTSAPAGNTVTASTRDTAFTSAAPASEARTTPSRSRDAARMIGTLGADKRRISPRPRARIMTRAPCSGRMRSLGLRIVILGLVPRIQLSTGSGARG